MLRQASQPVNEWPFADCVTPLYDVVLVKCGISGVLAVLVDSQLLEQLDPIVIANGFCHRRIETSLLEGTLVNPQTTSMIIQRNTIGHALIRSEEHTSELQSQFHLVCRLLL